MFAQGFVLYNIFGDYKVTPKFSVGGALTYAQRDKTAAGVDKKMGTELDFTATYKIYDNLSYMVGAGYLFAGDWYKSVAPAMAPTAEVENDYILMNKLTLTF
jgi:predicted porin